MNRIALTLAAATVATGLTFSSSAWAATNTAAPAQSSAMTAEHAQTPDTAGVRSFLANVANDALTRGDMSKLISNFTPTDQKRIESTSSYNQSYGTKLDGRIEQINQAWKAKYGHDFDARSAAYSASFASIQQGNAQSDPQLAQQVCGPMAQASGAHSSTAMKNQEIALVTLAASGKHTALNVPLMQESSAQWRLNAPSTLDASTLRQNLLNHLTLVGENSSKWPANENQAYEAVTRSVLAAILQPESHAAMTPAHATRSS